jgi:hypothetical protein
MLQPISLINEVYRRIKLKRARDINDQSRAVARLCELVQTVGFSSKVELTWEDYLPFRLPDENNPPKISPAAAITIRRLMKTGRLQPSIMVELLDELEKVERLRSPD